MKKTETKANRVALATQFTGTGVEIGVERGVFSMEILKATNLSHLYLVDPWKAYKGYRDHVSQDKLDGFHDETRNKVDGFKATIIRKESVEAANDFADNSLDFVYIDANHDKVHVTEDINAWIKKVRIGGIVSGHDYIKRKGNGYVNEVIEAVDEYCTANEIDNLIIWRGDKSPSWSFIKTK